MNARPFHRWRILAWGASLVLAATACSRREEPPAPVAAPPEPESAAAAAPLATAAAPAASAVPAPDAPPAAADLEKVEQAAAAFGDMVDSLRKFAGEEVELNADTLDLEAFLRGKSDRDLLTFAEGAQDKSPYAALQVLEYLLAHSADPRIRMKAAWRYGDIASDYGNAQDRLRGGECFHVLADLRGDEAFVAILSPGERNELLTAMQRLLLRLSLPPSAYQQMADVHRRHPASAEDLTYADWFEAMGLLRTGQEEHLTRMMACFRAIRERGVYGRYFADPQSIDRWLSMSDEQIKADLARFRHLSATAQPDPPDYRTLLDRQAESTPAPRKE